ncbi:MAG TPA: HD domain-containing protein [Syntrophales bacterium]|nr:HD domain-containing protein [Syntrophales bacterium]HPQ07290.1 HD domain-containing protein [Syntrophales bacterium]
MEREAVIETLRREIVRGEVRDGTEEAAVVRIAGRDLSGVGEPLRGEVTVRYFPFLVGRATGAGTSILAEPDLSVEERPPYRVSRRHLTLERRGREIWAVDAGSRYGSLVDRRFLGGGTDRPREARLDTGRHEILLGGEGGRVLLECQVFTEGSEESPPYVVTFGDRGLPVSELYGRLYRRTQTVLGLLEGDGRRGLETAWDLCASIHDHPEALDVLYYYSALPETGEDVLVTHALNVAIYTLRLAASLGMGRDEAVLLAVAALFHDLGMFDVPREIVQKRETITDGEFEVIKRHPRDGRDRLAAAAGLDPIVGAAAYGHHERVDGSGYPEGTRDLSEYVELIAMVDFFEAVTHQRPQRGPLTPHEGMRLLIDHRRRVFRPTALRSFLKAFSLFPIYSVVRLNTGEVGQVVKTWRERPLRPVVRVLFDHRGREAPAEKGLVDLARDERLFIVRDISDRVFIRRYFRLA